MSINTLISNIVNNILNPVIGLMVAIAVIVFLWGAFKFIKNADNSEERKKGSLSMMWGAIGLFIMMSAYGILNLIIATVRS